MDPSLHPKGRVNPEEEFVDSNERRIDVPMEMVGQIPERLVDENDEQDGRERMDDILKLPYRISPMKKMDHEEEPDPEKVAKEEVVPMGKPPPKEEDKKDQTAKKEEGQTMKRGDPFHRFTRERPPLHHAQDVS